MECDICRCTEYIRHCPSCGGDFCNECSKYVYIGEMSDINGHYECPNGCKEPLELYLETILEES